MNKTPMIVGGVLVLLLVLASGFAIGLVTGRGEGTGGHVASSSTDVPPRPRPEVPLVPGPAGQQIDAMRGGAPIDQEVMSPPIARVENTDVKRNRAYPMQPPTIPHSIDNYQVDRNSNRCLLCHARANADRFQAPPISVTHYMDRNDQFLATISPRRYFCNQCHVVQTDADLRVANNFEDIDTVLSREKAN